MRGHWWLSAAALGGAIACGSSGFFVCNGDDDCDVDGQAGLCQPTGGCSFADDDCDSGQRYGSGSAPSLAGLCVEDPVAMGSTDDGSEAVDTTADDGGNDNDDGDSSTGNADDATTNDTDDGSTDCPPGWWDCAWAYRQRLDLVPTVSETLQDIPVLIALGPGRIDYADLRIDGDDLRIVSAEGNVAPLEIQTFDPDGISTLWAAPDMLGGEADHLWLYYGNPEAERVDDPSPWASFLAVWHLDEGGVDSTGMNPATVQGAESAPGQLGAGQTFPSSSAKLRAEPSESLTDAFAGGGTLSAWIRLDGWGTGGYGRIVDKASSAAGVLFFVETGGILRFTMVATGSMGADFSTDVDTLELLRWTHVAVTFDSTSTAPPHLYVDGVEQPLVDPPSLDGVVLPTDADAPLLIGNRSTNDRRFEGVLDELRLQRGVRSPTWMTVQDASGRDELLTYGARQTQASAP